MNRFAGKKRDELLWTVGKTVGTCLSGMQHIGGASMPTRNLYFIYDDLCKKFGTKKADELFKKSFMKRLEKGGEDRTGVERAVAKMRTIANEGTFYSPMAEKVLDVLERTGVLKALEGGGIKEEIGKMLDKSGEAALCAGSG